MIAVLVIPTPISMDELEELLVQFGLLGGEEEYQKVLAEDQAAGKAVAAV